MCLIIWHHTTRRTSRSFKNILCPIALCNLRIWLVPSILLITKIWQNLSAPYMSQPSLILSLVRRHKSAHPFSTARTDSLCSICTLNVAISLAHDPTEVIWLTICVILYLKCSKLIHYRDRNEITKCNRWYVVDASHCANGSILWSYLPEYEIRRKIELNRAANRHNANAGSI